MPDVTSEEAAAGVSGFTVVFAAPNENVPAAPSNKPAARTAKDDAPLPWNEK